MMGRAYSRKFGQLPKLAKIGIFFKKRERKISPPLIQVFRIKTTH